MLESVVAILTKIYGLKITHRLSEFLEGELSVIMTLKEAPSQKLHPSELSEKLNISRARMTVLIRKLSAKNLVVVRQSLKDKRRSIVTLSDEGIAHAIKKTDEINLYLSRYLHALGIEDTKRLVSILEKSYHIMEAMSDE